MICTNEHNVMEGLGQPHELPGFKYAHEVNQYVSANSLKFLLVPFFIVHYGAFCYGHVSFVIGIFGHGSSINPRIGAALAELWQGPFSIAVAAIFASHLYSFFKNYIGGGEYARVNLYTLMFRPYGRIIVMHLTIIFGAGLAMALGSPLPMVAILNAGKILIDMRLHEKERAKLAAAD